MKWPLLLTASLILVSCAGDQRSPRDGIQNEDEIQREEDVQKEEATRTSSSDEIGPDADINGRTSSPTPPVN